MTSFYEIDRLLELRVDAGGPDSPSTIRTPELTLPDRYTAFADVASKEALDLLPPHRLYDYVIDLEGPNTLGYSPLYKMTTAELEETKRYLTENLCKGFIEPSQAPFSAPILFVKKADRSLRFCINFRKLNALTRKD